MPIRNKVLYLHKNTNGIFYIGIGTICRAYSKHNRSHFWKNIVNKYEYEVIICAENLSWVQAQKLEKIYIKLYGRRDLGLGELVNMTDGGDGVCNTNHRKGKKASPETIMKLRESHLGQKSWNKDKKASIETKMKMRLSRLGKSPWNKGKKGEYNTNHKGSFKLGHTPWNKGKKTKI